MPKSEPLRVAVLGAGPVGVEAGLYAKACGFAVKIYERGRIGEHLARWGHVKLFTPFGLNTTPLGMRTLLREKRSRDVPAETDMLTGRQFRESYLVPLAESEDMLESMHVQETIVNIGRSSAAKKSDPDERKPFRLLVKASNGQERIDAADVVLDCTGTYGTPNWLGDGNIPAVGEFAARQLIAHDLEDIGGEKKSHYAGKSIILVGDGYSAATTICELAAIAEEHHSTWVFWLTRGARGQPLPRVTNDPFKERDRLAVKANSLATRCDGNLEFHPQTVLDEVVSHGPDKGFRVAGRSNGKAVAWDVERVISAVGSRPAMTLTGGLKIDEPAGKPETREPGYFVLGAKSYGRATGFLMRDGFEQVRAVCAQLAGNPRLDLYAKKAA